MKQCRYRTGSELMIDNSLSSGRQQTNDLRHR